MMFIVRFIRHDGQPDENYYYHHIGQALDHLKLFLDDDSGLYKSIDILKETPDGEELLQSFIFPPYDI